MAGHRRPRLRGRCEPGDDAEAKRTVGHDGNSLRRRGFRLRQPGCALSALTTSGEERSITCVGWCRNGDGRTPWSGLSTTLANPPEPPRTPRLFARPSAVGRHEGSTMLCRPPVRYAGLRSGSGPTAFTDVRQDHERWRCQRRIVRGMIGWCDGLDAWSAGR
jgi:hypothetical protein